MKKIVSLLLVLCMAIGLASFAIAEDVPVINWYTKGDKPTDYDAVMEKVNEYLVEKIGATLNINFVGWGDPWDTFVSTSVATNDGAVDIMFTASWDRLNSHISNGYLMALNNDEDELWGNLLETYGQEIIANIEPGFITGNEINGALYGIACNKEIAANHGLCINTELIQKYGFDVSTIKTLADLEPMLAKIKEEMDAGNLPDLIAPFGINETAMGFFQPFVELAGDGTIVAQYDDNSSPTVVNKYATPEWKELLLLVQDWYRKGYIATDAIQHDDFGAEFQTGYYFAVPQSMKPGKGAEFSVNGVASTEVVLTRTVIRTKDVGGSMLAIVEGTKQADKAMQFINLLESDKYLINLIVFGLEGVHYNLVEGKDNIIQITDLGTSNYSMKGNAWMFGNQFLNYITTEEAEDKWDQFKAFNAAGIPVLSLGFQYDPTDFNPIITAVQDVEREYNALLIGAMDVETDLPKFIEAFEAAGINDFIADVQAQYDAWKAATAE